jgi:hypothetical protein
MSIAIAEGIHVADLRFGQAPLPPATPGFDPLQDAAEIYPAEVPSPATAPIPGTQATGSYAHGERYVVRVPDAWNGRLVVVGTPGLRSEFSNDAIWGDYVLARGFAFASSNKGIPYGVVVDKIETSTAPDRLYPIPFDVLNLETMKLGARFGLLEPSPVPIARWNEDFVALTVATQEYLGERFGGRPARTYAVGASNGGAQVRSLLESRPEPGPEGHVRIHLMERAAPGTVERTGTDEHGEPTKRLARWAPSEHVFDVPLTQLAPGPLDHRSTGTRFQLQQQAVAEARSGLACRAWRPRACRA